MARSTAGTTSRRYGKFEAVPIHPTTSSPDGGCCVGTYFVVSTTVGMTVVFRGTRACAARWSFPAMTWVADRTA